MSAVERNGMLKMAELAEASGVSTSTIKPAAEVGRLNAALARRTFCGVGFGTM